MRTQNPNTTEYLKNLWLSGYKNGIEVVDYTGQPEAKSRIYRLKLALYNYKRRIARKKLYPKYSEEYAIICSCSVTWHRYCPEMLIINRKQNLSFTKENLLKKANPLPDIVPDRSNI